MSASWVAGSVRAEAMARRRYGAAAARALAATPSLPEALTRLSATPFGHDVRAGQSLAEAEHALGATVLWHLRVLAGWAPWDGTGLLRVLAAGFEIANVDDLLASWDDGRRTSAYHLGALATAWPELAAAGSPTQLRTLLAESAWGDPGGDSPAAAQLWLRLAWARRAGGLVPGAWSLGAVALLVARENLAAGRLTGAAAELAGSLLGEPAVAATSLSQLAAAVPPDARWVLEDLSGPSDLWRGEAAWWRRVEEDGFRLLRSGHFGSSTLVGASAVLAADAWRVRAALELAARGGGRLEVFDDVA